MRPDTPSTADDLTRACSGMHVAAIPLFNRAVTTPDVEVAQRERRAAAAAALKKLTPAETEALVATLYEECRDKLKERESKIVYFLKRVFSFTLVPAPCEVKMIGAAYALDLPYLHGDTPMATMARKMGVTRASISNAATEFVKINRHHGVLPSRWMRSIKSSQASRTARERVCVPESESESENETEKQDS